MMIQPAMSNVATPIVADIAQSLQFAGVDAMTANQIAQSGPGPLHPDLNGVFVHDAARNGAVHGHSTERARELSAAAYSAQTQLALHAPATPHHNQHLVAHEAAHTVQYRSGPTQSG